MMPNATDIVRRHGPMVWGTLCRLVGAGSGRRQADVEDAFQEVFVAALEVGRREEVQNWEAMLRRIATRKGLDLLRTRVRQRGRENGNEAWDSIPGKGETVEAILERGELAAELRAALARLGAEEAELFCLRHLQEMSYEQIAHEMEMSPGAVGVALHRIREKLRSWMSARNVWSQKEVRDE